MGYIWPGGCEFFDLRMYWKHTLAMVQLLVCVLVCILLCHIPQGASQPMDTHVFRFDHWLRCQLFLDQMDFRTSTSYAIHSSFRCRLTR
jgi:hypothetical protein